MAQENEHVKKLIAARERIIQDRRNLADALANEYKGGHTERMRDSFVVTQNAIEAIDRAIAQVEFSGIGTYRVAQTHKRDKVA